MELKFLTNSTDPADIAADISDRVAAIKNNVSGLIKIERDSEEDDEKDDDEAEPEVTVTGGQTTTLTTTQTVTRTAREKLKAEAKVNGNTTKVEFEYTFFLNVTEDSAVITAVEDKLSTLTDENILDALDVEEKRVEIKEMKPDKKKKVETNEGEQETRNTRNSEGFKESEEED